MRVKDKSSSYYCVPAPSPNQKGFTLIELLVVIVVIAILAGMLIPVLAKAKFKSQGLFCMNNHRQLSLAWRMYTDDSNDNLPYATASPGPLAPYSWVQGALDFNPNNRSNWDIEADLVRSPLWSYSGKAPGIWKCPADTSKVTLADGRVMPRVRSMSMSIWVGGWGLGSVSAARWNAGCTTGDWKVYGKSSDFNDPGPARTWVLVDAREDRINYGNFFTDMTGFPGDTSAWRFHWDLPGSYHHRAGGFSFADGHAEIKKWLDDRTMPPVLKNAAQLSKSDEFVDSPGNPDINWMQERSTRISKSR